MSLRACVLPALMALFPLGILANGACAQSPREQLGAMVRQLHDSPTDILLRERIIKAALALRPAPAMPEDARMHFVRGVTLQKGSKDKYGYELAAGEYEKALLLAPWAGDVYFNYSVVLEQLEKFDGAIDAARLYGMASGSSETAREAQDRIYALEAKRQLAAHAGVAEFSADNDHLIVPGERIGPIRIGMSYQEVVRLLGPPDHRLGTTDRISDREIDSYEWDHGEYKCDERPSTVYFFAIQDKSHGLT